MDWRSALVNGSAELGLALDADQLDQLVAYAGLLLKWNRVYNLTAIRQPQEVLTHHLLDSLAVVAHCQRYLRLVDIGSGGGLPGIVLAIAKPEMQIISIEPVNKKISFQQQVKIELALENFKPIRSRAENVSAACMGGSVDVAIARAFASLADFVKVAEHLLHTDGRVLAMKGQMPNEELKMLPPNWRLEKSEKLWVPGLSAERHLLSLQRT